MRPNIRDTTDPLDLSLLPPTDGMQLAYRTQPQSEGKTRAAAVYHVISAATIAVLIVLLCRGAAGFLKLTDSPLYYMAILFWAFLYPAIALLALVRYLRGAETETIIFMLAAPPAVWGLLHLITMGYYPVAGYLLLFVPAILLAAWASDRVLLHYAAWMASNPMLDGATRGWWLAAVRARLPRNLAGWRAELRRLLPRSQNRLPVYEADALSYPAIAIILVALLFVSFLIFLFCRILPELRLFAGMLALPALLALLLSARALWDYYAQLPPIPARVIVRVAWRALSSWLTYNAHQTQAPGVFQSPAGSATRRLWIWRATVFALTLSILPVAAYFPVVPFVIGPQAWIEASRHLGGEPPEPVDDSAVSYESLDEPERVYFDTLEDDAQRSAYLAEIAAERAELLKRARQRKSIERTHAFLAQTPEMWIAVAVGQAFQLNPISSTAFFLSVAFCIAAGPLAFFMVLAVLGGRLLAIQYLSVEAPGAPAQAHGRSLWDCRVERLITSTFEAPFGEATVREADHLWLGTSTVNDYPILLDRAILREHAHVLGSSGSGKTALGLMPLITQLIRHKDSSVIVIDLKGDPALFTGTREEAQAAALPFKWFTTELNHATYVFNPMLQSHHSRLSLHQRTELLIGAFGLKYGRFYGRDYFSDVQSHLLFRALRYQPDCPSFAHLFQLLRNRQVYQGMQRKQLEDAFHIWGIVDRLASFPALNACPQRGYSSTVLENAIHLDNYFESPGVLYFYLPAALESVSVAEIGRLALYSAITAAATKRDKRPQLYLFIDEFQQIVSSNLEIILRHARSMGIGIILANQTLPDLKTPDGDLVPIVFSNTRFKQIFSVNDVFQQEYLMKASGEAIYEFVSKTQSESVSRRDTIRTTAIHTAEHVGPRHRVNDIIEFSNHPERCLVHVNRGSGLTQFGGYGFVMACKFHITQAEYERRKHAPWPRPDDKTITPDFRVDSDNAQSTARAERRAHAEETFDQITFEGLASLLDEAKKDEGLFDRPTLPAPKPQKPRRKREKG